MQSITITIKGKEYTLSPLTIGAVKNVPNYIKGCNIKLIQESVAGELKNELIREELKRDISADELEKWQSSPEGLIYVVWASLKVKHDLSPQDVGDLFDIDDLALLNSAVEKMSDVKKKEA